MAIINDENDDTDVPRRRRSRRKAARASTAALGLGIASLSVGTLGLALSWVAVVGPLVCGIGLVLGTVALILAMGKGRGHGMPVAGSAVSGAGLVVSLILTLVVLNAADKAAQQLAVRQAPPQAVETANRMAGAPWYLLATGIVLVIVGYLSARLGGGGSRVYISPKMSDEEIERLMSQAQGSRVAGLMVALGFLMAFISIVWRLVRALVA